MTSPFTHYNILFIEVNHLVKYVYYLLVKYHKEEKFMVSPVKIGAAIAAVGLVKKLFSDSPGKTAQPTITWSGTYETDYRAKLIIPQWYIDNLFPSKPSYFVDQVERSGGIVFPYTPTISYETKADYSNQHPMHSNYALHFYKNSSVSNISLSAKFTVQNDNDAGMYLTVKHLLTALTKMRTANDDFGGAPPPVCRLNAYGDYMFRNVPVAVGSVKIELPDNVDYYLIKTDSKYAKNDPLNAAAYTFGENNFVPTNSTISLTLVPMYSRNEMLNYGVGQFLNGTLNQQGSNNKGYL